MIASKPLCLLSDKPIERGKPMTQSEYIVARDVKWFGLAFVGIDFEN